MNDKCGTVGGAREMKKLLKSLVLKSIIVGFVVWVLGFASMNLWWNILPRNNELYGLYHYRAATWGDGICLPLLTGALYYIGEYKNNKKLYILIGIVAFFIGFGIQISWLFDDNIVLNWTIPKVNHFNIAGWWHAIFFSLMFGILGTLLSKYVGGKAEDSSNESILISNYIIWFSGTLFLLLHCLDDYIEQGREVQSLLIITSIISVFVICCILCVKKIKKESDSGEIIVCAISGITTALGACLFIVGGWNRLDLLAVGNFALAFMYLIPNEMRLKCIISRGIIVATPVLFLDLAMISVADMLSKIILIIIGIVVSLIAAYKFNVVRNEYKTIKAYLLMGMLAQFATVGTLFFLSIGKKVVDAITTLFINLVMGVAVQAVVGKNFDRVKNKEDMEKGGEKSGIELSSVKASVYFLIIISAIGGVIYLVVLMQNFIQINDLYIRFGIDWINCKVIMYGMMLLMMLFALGVAKNIYCVNKRSYTVSVYLLGMATYAILFILMKNIRNSLVIRLDIVNICVFILILGSSLLVSESFYSNLFRIRGIMQHKDSIRRAGYIVFIGSIINIGVCVFPVWNVNENGYNLEYMLIGIVGLIIALVGIPWLFGRAICPPVADIQIGTTTPSEGILQNGFLGTLIVVLSGQFPVYFIAVNEGRENSLCAITSLVLFVCWVLEYCLANNVETLKKRQREVKELGKNEIAIMELEGLEKHLKFQNISAFVALLLYSLIPLAIKVGFNIIGEGDIKEVWKKYIPKL